MRRESMPNETCNIQISNYVKSFRCSTIQRRKWLVPTEIMVVKYKGNPNSSAVYEKCSAIDTYTNSIGVEYIRRPKIFPHLFTVVSSSKIEFRLHLITKIDDVYVYAVYIYILEQYQAVRLKSLNTILRGGQQNSWKKIHV